jgi:folate-dependent phosphoribosylglycinamide formyltransferase PurN
MANIVLLTTDSEIGCVAANYLAASFPGQLTIIIEKRFSRFALLRRRVRRLGAVHVFGQVCFIAVQQIQKLLSRPRIDAALQHAGMRGQWPVDAAIKHVPSVNDPSCVILLQQLDPAVILVVGTRLIQTAVLDAIKVPFINYHAGITPKYRGAHGAYWAMAHDDNANCGITIHLVDAGIDTGAVLYQERISPAPGDNFTLYAFRQLITALPLLTRAANDAVAGALQPHKVDLPSRLWSHPTLWGYLATGLHKGVW